MPDKKVFTAKDGAVFIQREASLPVEYLGCVDLEDISADDGDITLIQGFGVNGEYEVQGYTKDAPSPVTTSLTLWLGKVAEFLEDVRCPFYLHVNMRCGGLANVLANYDRALILQVAAKTNRTVSGLAKRNEDAEAEQSFDLSALPPIIDVYKLTPDRQTNAETRAMNDVFFINADKCADCGGVAIAAGQYGAASTDGAVGQTANVNFTTDSGQNWAAGAADPFAAAEDVQPIVGFYINRSTIRWLAGRGTTDAGNPAEIAYSDDQGATWTLVNVGATNAQYFLAKKTIFVYDMYNIWAVTSGGYVYKSENGGGSWTAQESGVLTASNLNVIRFAPGSKLVGYAAGASNAIIRTLDGGVTWASVTGPSGQAAVAINCMEVRDRYNVFLGYADGKLYRTKDGGVTWTRITGWTGDGVGQVRDIMFVNDVVGFMIVNNATPVGTMLFTRDCGNTWEALTTSTNTGLNALAAVKAKLAYAVGELQGGTAVILKTA